MSKSLHQQVEAIMRDAAARAILPRYRTLAHSEINAKAMEQVGDPTLEDVVTIADHESEAILAEALARLLPEATIVGEEAAFADPAVLERLGGDLCWVIDPLDGTNNFAGGNPPFGILVALAEAGEAIGGWILDPLSGRFCAASKGEGATVNGKRVAARTSGEDPPIAAISLLFADPARRAALKREIAPNYRLVDIPRCAAEQYPRIVLGVNDVSIFERTLAWDHAAGVLFVNEAGGKAARPDGSPYRLDDARSGLVGAASPALWDELAERLARLQTN
ncbi:MAG: inositol monophosphatase [Novosphingobium sp.]|nr:inositol monophosphatase [Novosphingobium sp.]